MFCSICGKQLKNGVRFCGGCGNAVKEQSFSTPTPYPVYPQPQSAQIPLSEPEPPRAQKRLNLVILGVLAVVLIISGGIFLMFGRSALPVTSPADHLSLGERFLLEMNYEQALVHFLALIDIEPMNPRGYTGAAEAHIGLGQVDEAIAVLRLGQERLPDNVEIREMLDGLVPAAVEPLTPLPEPESESVEAEEEYEESESEAQIASILLAERLIELYQTSGYYAVITELRTEEFRNNIALTILTVINESGGQPIIHFAGDGFGGGFYLVNYAIFFYIGGYDGYIRSGHGTWIRSYNDYSYSVFSGEWVQDMPNGFGEIVSASRDPNASYTSQVTTGAFVNGLNNGAMTHTRHTNFQIFPIRPLFCDVCILNATYRYGYIQTIEYVGIGPTPIHKQCTGCERQMSIRANVRYGVSGFR